LPSDERVELEEEILAALAAETTLGKYRLAFLHVRGHADGNQPATSLMNELQTDLLSAAAAVQTGFTDLDELTGGLRPSDFIVIGASPGMGKTTFAMNIAEHAAIKEGRSVAVFSMKIVGDHYAQRLMSSLGRVDLSKVHTGELDDDDWPRLTAAVSILSEAPLFIDDTPTLTPAYLRERALRLNREHNLGLIVIDDLQLMRVPGHIGNRADKIAEISSSLKALAKELNVPVIALSRLNRSLELRPNKRPVMTDLMGPGAIEEAADVVMFIYRDEVYDEDSYDKGTAEIIVGKYRNGATGMRRLTFLGRHNRFENFIAADEYTVEDLA
jgi:replicative DNA helicase